MAATGRRQGPKTIQQAVIINDIHTDIVFTWFSDRIMIVVTQLNKFGILMNIKREKTVSRSLTPTENPHTPSTYSTKVLMGKDEPIWHVYGRQIAMAASDENDQSNRPILLTIALKEHSPDILHCITDLIKEIKNHNIQQKM